MLTERQVHSVVSTREVLHLFSSLLEQITSCERMKFNPLLARHGVSTFSGFPIIFHSRESVNPSWQLRKTDPDHRPFDTCGRCFAPFSTWWGRRKRVRSCKRKSAFFLNLARKNKFQGARATTRFYSLLSSTVKLTDLPRSFSLSVWGVDWSFLFGIGFIILLGQRAEQVSLSCRGGKGAKRRSWNEMSLRA